MADENKLKLDDITFDDFIGEGLQADATVVDELNEEPEVKELEEIEEVEEEVQAPKPAEKKEEKVVEENVEESISEDSEIDETVVSEVLSQLVYEIEEECEDTSAGLIKLTIAVGGKIAEQQLDNLIQAHPEIQKHL